MEITFPPGSVPVEDLEFFRERERERKGVQSIGDASPRDKEEDLRRNWNFFFQIFSVCSFSIYYLVILIRFSKIARIY